MRPTSDVWKYAIPTAHRVVTRIQARLAGKVTADRVPMLSGSITYDDTASNRRRVSFTVPAKTPDGTRWDPGESTGHPLAQYGQRVWIRTGIELPTGGAELMNHGWYLIDSWERDETTGEVEVTAVDLAQLLADARHYTTETPGKGNTYAKEFARLAGGILPVRVDPKLPATKVNAATVWDRDRVKNLTDLCDAWGARWFVADDGYLTAAPVYPAVTTKTPYQLRLISGRSGTVVKRTREGSRERLYNAIVASGKAGENNEPGPWAVAEITDPKSAIRVGGPYGRRPRFYASDMLTTKAQCLKAARGLLPAASSNSRTEPIECVPDPCVELGDVAEVMTGGQRWRGRIQSLELPLTASGPMQVTITNTPELAEES